MARKSFFSSAALAALTLAAIATPAQAQRWERGGGDVDRSTARSENRQIRAEARQQARVERQRPQAQAQAPVAAQQRAAPEGGWRAQRSADGQRGSGRTFERGGNRERPAWSGSAAPSTDRSADAARQGWRGRDGQNWSGERNRSYVDPNRNSTYRNGYRDGRTADQRRDRVDQREAYRDGYRNGTRADQWRDRRDQNQAYRQGYNSANRDWSRNRYSGDYRRWNRNDWRRDNRYNWYGYRSQHRDLFRAGRYYSPYRNWSYNRLSIGIFLEPLFYGNRYWVNDPWQYRLPEVYGPYRWVRYYDDVLLVDIYSGEVVDVIHDFFW